MSYDRASGVRDRKKKREMILGELDDLNSRLDSLSSMQRQKAATTTRARPVAEPRPAPKNDDFNNIFDRWKRINTPPPEPRPVVQQQIQQFLPPPQLVPSAPAVDTDSLVTVLEHILLEVLKSCIKILTEDEIMDNPWFLMLLQGNLETITDYERLYEQLKIMLYIQKIKEESPGNLDEGMMLLFGRGGR